MTQEEKAKAYDKALSLMVDCVPDKDGLVHVRPEDIFSELRESEDERIRKSIIAIINNYVDNSNTFKPKMLAWLEKQGNVNALIQEAAEKSYTEGMRVERKRWLDKQGEKPTLPKWKYKKDNTPLLRDSIILNKYGCVAKSPSGAIISDAWVLDYDELAKLPKEEITKQGEQKYMPKYKIGDYVKNTNYKGEPIYEIIYMDKECYICEYRGKERMGDKAVMHFSFDNPYLRLVQKPTDKVESKFHEGEWVVDKQGIVHQIANVVENVTNHTYGYDVVGDGYFNDNTEGVRLWTINDAKDGDVLSSGQLVFIFKVIHGVWLNCHCSAHNDGSFIADSYDLMTNKYFSEVHPATKEQHTELFQKIKEAGYEWDDGKKELRKILKLSNSAKTCNDDTLLDLLHKMPSYITVDGIDYHFVLKKTIAYETYYEGVKEGCEKTIFWTGGDPVDILTEMLEKLKEKGLLE